MFDNIWGNVAKLLREYWQIFLLEGVANTLKLTVIAVFFGAILGTIVAFLRRSRIAPVRWITVAYVEVLRGTPILLQLYVFYFVLPLVIPIKLSQFMWVAVALCINSSAYVSEVVRSGIQAVDKGQSEAARSLGLGKTQTMMHIVLPQAVRNILPALGNEFIMMLKETSLASTFYLGDLMTSFLKVKGATYLTFEALLIVGVIYFVMTFSLSKVVAAFERRMASGQNN